MVRNEGEPVVRRICFWRLEAFNGETSLSMTLKMDPEDTAELLVTLFNEFGLNLMTLLSVFTTPARSEKKFR